MPINTKGGCVECPYYRSEEAKKIHCEVATLKFPNKEERLRYKYNYCAKMETAKKCTLYAQLTEYYERKYSEESPKPTPKMIIGVLP